jgi:hypothetical protein
VSAALPEEAFYLPFEAGPHRMTMGLVARGADEVFEIDRLHVDEMAQRRALLAAHHPEIVAVLPEAADACREVLDTVAEVLPRRYPAWFMRDGDVLRNRLTGEDWDLAAPGLAPLEMAARLVQEDLCILTLTETGPVLTGGVVCFTTGWRLVEKLGLPLADVHGPVPLYADRLARPVDRLMGQLKPGKLVERLNWGLYDSPALFRPGGHFRSAHNDAVTRENAGETVFLRVERQTLRALPRSGSVLFTIRTHVYPLARVAAAGAAGRLADAVRALPPSMHLYKSIAPFSEALLSYLEGR